MLHGDLRRMRAELAQDQCTNDVSVLRLIQHDELRTKGHAPVIDAGPWRRGVLPPSPMRRAGAVRGLRVGGDRSPDVCSPFSNARPGIVVLSGQTGQDGMPGEPGGPGTSGQDYAPPPPPLPPLNRSGASSSSSSGNSRGNTVLGLSWIG
jgi:hypothetical protein